MRVEKRVLNDALRVLGKVDRQTAWSTASRLAQRNSTG